MFHIKVVNAWVIKQCSSSTQSLDIVEYFVIFCSSNLEKLFQTTPSFNSFVVHMLNIQNYSQLHSCCILHIFITNKEVNFELH